MSERAGYSRASAGSRRARCATTRARCEVRETWLQRSGETVGMRVAVIGTGLIGASVALAARRAGLARRARLGRGRRSARDGGRARSGRAAPTRPRRPPHDAELVVVAVQVTLLSDGRRGRARRRAGGDGDGRRLDEGGARARGRRSRASSAAIPWPAPRCAGPRARARISSTARRGSWRRTPTTDTARYRELHAFVALARRRSGRDRPGCARPAARARQPPAARAREPAPEPGRRRADRGARPARRGGRVVPRDDARRGREPAHLGRHLPRQRAPSCATRSPSTAAASSSSRRRSERGDAGFLARWIGEAATKREELLRDAFEETAELFRVRVHVADRPGILAAIMQALGAERINIEDLELHHVSRERGGTLAFLVSGAGGGEPRGRRPRQAGIRRGRGPGDTLVRWRPSTHPSC